MSLPLTLAGTSAVGLAYRDKVLGTAGLLAYWPLDDLVGAAQVTDIGPNGWHGVGYTGVTLQDAPGPDGLYNCPAFVHATPSQANLYSAALGAAWDGDENTIIQWLKIDPNDNWTDGISGYWLSFISNTGDMHQLAESGVVNNRFGYTARLNGVTDVRHIYGIDFTNWFTVAVTNSWTNTRHRCYVNGDLLGDRDTSGMGQWTGTLLANRCLVGDFAGNDAWYGWLADIIVFNRELTPAEIMYLAQRPGVTLDSTAGLWEAA